MECVIRIPELPGSLLGECVIRIPELPGSLLGMQMTVLASLKELAE